MNFILHILTESWAVLLESAPFMLFGFFLAGLLKALVPPSLMTKHLGGTGLWPVLKAALVGVPIPLCSCGVLPAAAGLRDAGASKGAAAAFMISTPETGVDSIAVNWALLDPLMTIVRPVAAFVTGALAGVLVNRFAPDEAPAGARPRPLIPLDAFAVRKPPLLSRLRAGLEYAFGEMLSGIGRWFLLGVLVAGLIGAILPADGMERVLGTGLWPMLAMLALGIPLYVCATASTPIAAALAMKGLSPGAALVFLLAGPATNAAGITVVARMLGLRATGIYLACIAGCSLLFGLAVDALYLGLGLGVSGWVHASMEEADGWFGYACAALLLALVARQELKKLRPGGRAPRPC
ncbi:permease [Fundidesulfovibrio agrisoli]|uniref:permease n=1 Tax=Fundidesulfovibrio agrisoli TaxID=2922717 RepID=UPI001FADA85D|nr:permease [Fundidesulfovibrio agrisoli]